MHSTACYDEAIETGCFERAWADRNCDRVHVFANGHKYDKAERRKDLRMLIAMMKRSKCRRCGRTRAVSEKCWHPSCPIGQLMTNRQAKRLKR